MGQGVVLRGEWLGPATAEERTVVSTLQSQVGGIKDTIERGGFRSQNFVDPLPGHYPSEQQEKALQTIPR